MTAPVDLRHHDWEVPGFHRCDAIERHPLALHDVDRAGDPGWQMSLGQDGALNRLRDAIGVQDHRRGGAVPQAGDYRHKRHHRGARQEGQNQPEPTHAGYPCLRTHRQPVLTPGNIYLGAARSPASRSIQRGPHPPA
jgi:hypothetical protein